jgi:hypothetical protein
MNKVRSACKGNKDEILKKVRSLQLNVRFWGDFFSGIEILIVDNFFCKENFYMLLMLMSEKIRKNPINKEERKRVITILSRELSSNEINSELNKGHYAELKKHYYFQSVQEFEGFSAHDRFVFVNDHFWHFGVSIGGMYTGFQLNAYSGPWQDNGSFADAIYKKLPAVNRL